MSQDRLILMVNKKTKTRIYTRKPKRKDATGSGKLTLKKLDKATGKREVFVEAKK